MSQPLAPQQMTPQQQGQQPQVPYNPEPEALRNLMVNYIPTTVDEVQLRQLFERFGPIEGVKVVCDRETRQSRGYGFVKFQSAASAQQAITEMNGYSIINKRLKVALAAAGNQRQRPYNNQGGNPVAQGAHMNAGYPGNFGGYPVPAAAGAPGAFGGYPAAPNPYQQQQMMAMQQQYMMQAAQPPQGHAPGSAPPRR